MSNKKGFKLNWLAEFSFVLIMYTKNALLRQE